MVLSKEFRTRDDRIIIDPIRFLALVVDWQATFKMGGGLGVEGGHELTIPVLKLIRKFPKNRRICTRDIHPYGHVSFASSYVGYAPFYKLTYDEAKDWTAENHRIAPHALFSLEELKEYLKIVGSQILWPDHAVEGEDETRVDPYIEPECMITWNKGNRPHRDSYSAFEDNGGDSTRLDQYISCRGVDMIVMCGIAFDVCLGYSALHARKYGFEVHVVIDLCPAISEAGALEMIEKLKEAGVHLITSDQLVGAKAA